MDLLGGVQKAMRRVLVARGVESKVVSVSGQSVHMYELRGQGKGPPVVLVHGLGGSANGFAGVFFGLRRRFSRVLALDLPGHGFSEQFCGGPVCVRGQFDVLRDWCQQVVGEPAFVVGNSLGGAMVVNLAVEAPSLVRALGLVAPAGAALSEQATEALLNSFAIETATEARALTRRLFHKPPLPLMLFAAELRKFYVTPTVQALAAEARATRASLSPEHAARPGHARAAAVGRQRAAAAGRDARLLPDPPAAPRQGAGGGGLRPRAPGRAARRAGVPPGALRGLGGAVRPGVDCPGR